MNKLQSTYPMFSGFVKNGGMSASGGGFSASPTSTYLTILGETPLLRDHTIIVLTSLPSPRDNIFRYGKRTLWTLLTLSLGLEIDSERNILYPFHLVILFQ